MVISFLRKLILSLWISTVAFAASSPVGGGLWPWAQAPDSDGAVKGLRLNGGWGVHKTVYGLDFGVANSTTKDFVGMGFGILMNSTAGKATIIGVQLGGLLNLNAGKTSVNGFQVAGLLNLNHGDNYIHGVQFGTFANLGKNHIYGLQLGMYNEAEVVNGIQIGLVNKTKNLHGLQIGLMNFAEKGGLSFSPVLNVGF